MQKLPAILAVLISGAAGAAAPDAPAEPPAPAVQAAQPAAPAAKRNAPRRNASSADEELKQKCASRMYGASPRGRGAVNWTVYDRCMKNGGHL